MSCSQSCFSLAVPPPSSARCFLLFFSSLAAALPLHESSVKLEKVTYICTKERIESKLEALKPQGGLYASDFCEIFFVLDLSNEMIVLESLHYSRRYAVMSETLNPKIWILGFIGGIYLLSLQEQKRSYKECAGEKSPLVPTECVGLRETYFQCKRGQVVFLL